MWSEMRSINSQSAWQREQDSAAWDLAEECPRCEQLYIPYRDAPDCPFCNKRDDGTLALVSRRVVCQNTLNIALEREESREDV